jgi:hypothetical protein
MGSALRPRLRLLPTRLTMTMTDEQHLELARDRSAQARVLLLEDQLSREAEETLRWPLLVRVPTSLKFGAT